jgi:hypothetical protein
MAVLDPRRRLTLRRAAVGFCAAVLGTAVFAMEIVADGEAVIENDDITFARQIALRRAMASAVEQSGGLLHSSTVSTPAGVQERTALTGNSRVLGARIVAERVEKGTLRLSAEVQLGETGQAQACNGMPRRKVAVAGFPLQYPEQIASGEFTGWPYATAEELSELLNRNGKLLAASIADRMAFDAAEAAPEPARREGVPLLVDWARGARAQYVIAGVFRDMGKAARAFVIPEQQLALEAFIYDGFSGELLARQSFSRPQISLGGLPRDVRLGSKSFRSSRLGENYLALLREIGDWAENTVACMPFAARVIQASGRRLHIDVGSDSGIEAGMEFLLSREGASTVATPAGDPLGRDRKALAGVVIKSVNPRYSVAEITARKNPPPARVGDVLFGQ